MTVFTHCGRDNLYLSTNLSTGKRLVWHSEQ